MAGYEVVINLIKIIDIVDIYNGYCCHSKDIIK